ncbi:hypothetical protein, partial [Aeromonas dhakensis]|uniref:hypothetical protein n=1 Tax=Aeromonas dhakensis TaxID=196024 RepID=UPI00399EFADF
ATTPAAAEAASQRRQAMARAIDQVDSRPGGSKGCIRFKQRGTRGANLSQFLDLLNLPYGKSALIDAKNPDYQKIQQLKTTMRASAMTPALMVRTHPCSKA